MSVRECLFRRPRLSSPSSTPLGLYMGIFCKGIPFALSMRHRLTVAGNYGRLFNGFGVFCCPLRFLFFSATKLLHEVCLKNLHRVLSGIRREKHCYYTINCISFLGHQELFRDRIKCGIISTTMKFETYA